MLEYMVTKRTDKKVSILFGLVSAEGYLDAPIALNPCRICGSTDVHLSHVRILWLHRWLVHCIPCNLDGLPKELPHQACIAWNNNERK